MYLSEINSKLKRIVDTDFERDLYRYINDELKYVFLKAQKDQIFKESIDNEGYPIGFYSQATEYFDSDKKAGMPFTMVETGEFFNSIQFSATYRKIKLFSDSKSYYDIMANNTANYTSKDFFGITSGRLNNIIRKWIKPYLIKKASLR